MFRDYCDIYCDALKIATSGPVDFRNEVRIQFYQGEYPMNRFREEIEDISEEAAEMFVNIGVDTIMNYITIVENLIEFDFAEASVCAKDVCPFRIPLDFDIDAFIHDAKFQTFRTDETTLLDAIETNIPSRYAVLEGDGDTIYVKDKATEKHFAIHVSECDDED